MVLQHSGSYFRMGNLSTDGSSTGNRIPCQDDIPMEIYGYNLYITGACQQQGISGDGVCHSGLWRIAVFCREMETDGQMEKQCI